MTAELDVHFLIDNAPPIEVEYILRILDRDIAFSTRDLRERLLAEWGLEVQRNFTNSTRRLNDLGLSDQQLTTSGKPGHLLTAVGENVRSILSVDRALYAEVMHYLHYTCYDENNPSSRKLLWSYRACSDIVWERQEIPRVSEMVAVVQSRIAAEFPQIYAGVGVGGRFNAGGITSGWKPWVAQLDPSPILSESTKLEPRNIERFELALLGLDHVYRAKRYRYGDPVILDEGLLDEIARVFFLDRTRCRQLLDLADKITNKIDLSDTFAGTSITLAAPFRVDNI